MTKKREWILFAVVAAVVVCFLVLTYFNAEHVVPYEEAMEYIRLIDGESAIIITLDCSKGTIYAYNDARFDTGESDNIYIVYKQSIFDRWFNKSLPNFETIVVHKASTGDGDYEMPRIWYFEDMNDPMLKSVSLNERIIPVNEP